MMSHVGRHHRIVYTVLSVFECKKRKIARVSRTAKRTTYKTTGNDSGAMQLKNVLKGGIFGGFVLLVLVTIFSELSVLVAPYNIATLGGMRAMDDPVMLLYFLYPFVFAFAAALVFDVVQGSLTGKNGVQKGLIYGGLLFLLVTIPSVFVMASSMTYPVGFYLAQVLEGIVGYPVLGAIFAWIWKL